MSLSHEEIQRLTDFAELSRLFSITEERDFLNQHLSAQDINECVSAGSTNLERMPIFILKLIRCDGRDFYDNFVEYFMKRCQQYRKMYLKLKYGKIDSLKNKSTQISGGYCESSSSDRVFPSPSCPSSCSPDDSSKEKKSLLFEWNESSSVARTTSSENANSSELQLDKVEDLIRKCLSSESYLSESSSSQLLFGGGFDEIDVKKECISDDEQFLSASGNLTMDIEQSEWDDCDMDEEVLRLLESDNLRTSSSGSAQPCKSETHPAFVMTCFPPSISNNAANRQTSSSSRATEKFPKIEVSLPPIPPHLLPYFQGGQVRFEKCLLRNATSLFADYYHRRVPKGSDVLVRRYFNEISIALSNEFPSCTFGDRVDNPRRFKSFVKRMSALIRRRRYLGRLSCLAAQRQIVLHDTTEKVMTSQEREENQSTLENELKRDEIDADHCRELARRVFDANKLPYSSWPKHLCLPIIVLDEFERTGRDLHTLRIRLRALIERLHGLYKREDFSPFLVLQETHSKLSRKREMSPINIFTREGDVRSGGIGLSLHVREMQESFEMVLTNSYGETLVKGNVIWEDAILVLMSAYYLMDINYPKAYSQLLGLLQQTILMETFPCNNKAIQKLLSKIASGN